MIEHTLNSISQFYPEIIIVLTLCVIIVVDLVVKKKKFIISWLLIGGLVLAGITVLLQIGRLETVFYDMIAVDPFAVFLKVLIILSALFVVLFSMQNDELDSYSSRIGEYYMLLTGMVLGMLLMVSSTNLLLMYLAFEIASISSYVLVGFTKQSKRSSESSIKYIIYGAVSSGIMLYGITLLIGLAGTANIYEINTALSNGFSQTLLLNLSILMIIVGLGFKVAVVPFHFWAPDVYEGAPISITAILAVSSKIAALGMLVRLFTVSFVDTGAILSSDLWQLFEGIQWNVLLAVMAALAMIVGNFTALRQDNIKRMLAYSSIAHAGYILMGAVILTEQGITSLLIYIFIYLFMNLGAFYIAMLFANKTNTESIEQYKGLGHRAPLQGIAMTIFLVSLTGLPPTGGFIAKFYIFGAAISANWIWLAAIAGLTSIVSLYYYIRVVRNLFFFQPEENAQKLVFSRGSKVVLMLLLVPTLFLGIYFTPLIEFAQHSIKIFGLN